MPSLHEPNSAEAPGVTSPVHPRDIVNVDGTPLLPGAGSNFHVSPLMNVMRNDCAPLVGVTDAITLSLNSYAP
jgi:hypothetical protein